MTWGRSRRATFSGATRWRTGGGNSGGQQAEAGYMACTSDDAGSGPLSAEARDGETRPDDWRS